VKRKRINIGGGGGSPGKEGQTQASLPSQPFKGKRRGKKVDTGAFAGESIRGKSWGESSSGRPLWGFPGGCRTEGKEGRMSSRLGKEIEGERSVSAKLSRDTFKMPKKVYTA